MWSHPVRTLVGIWAIATVIVSQMGPFGTYYTLDELERGVYWGTVIAMSIVVSGILRQIVVETFGRDLNPLTYDMLIAPPFVLIYTPLLQCVSNEFSHSGMPLSIYETGFLVVSISFAGVGLREVMRLHRQDEAEQNNQATRQAEFSPVRPRFQTEDTEREAFPVAMLETQFWKGGTAPAQSEAAPSADAKGGTPALMSRLPPELRGPILCFSGNDHYLDVTTENGRGSVLLRFSDGLREIDPALGLRIHRSHWVAYAAVRGLRREGQKLFVVMQTGEELPVSRTYCDPVRARWDLL